MKKIFKILTAAALTFSLVACGESEPTGDPITVISFAEMSKEEVKTWCEDNGVKCSIESEYSDNVAAGSVISQSEDEGNTVYEGDTITVTYSMGEEPSVEFKNALASAEIYSDMMNMSKQGIYDQLTSEYGDQFEADAAQWAIDNLDADWKENALKSAETYSDMLHMSKQGIYDQLISEYGDQFTAEEAQYAIDNIQADWKENALKSAKSYQETMNMSKNAIYDQLISEYGEQFTAEEAQYAIDNLPE